MAKESPKTFPVKLYESTLEQARQLAERTGLSVSLIIRRSVEEGFPIFAKKASPLNHKPKK